LHSVMKDDRCDGAVALWASLVGIFEHIYEELIWFS